MVEVLGKMGWLKWIAWVVLCTSLPGIAMATSRIGPPIYHVRLNCVVTQAAAATSSITKQKLCDEAQVAIQELADGKIDDQVAQLNGWAIFANPNKQKVLDECRKQEAVPGTCDEDNYDLLYRGHELPVIDVNIDDMGLDQEGVTVIIEAAAGSPGSSDIALSVETIEPAFNVMPEERTNLPTITLAASRISDSLHAKLKLALAHYFSPDTLNRILANVVARNKH
jgi:hypothetical protein